MSDCKTQTVSVEVPVFDGFEFVRYGKPVAGDYIELTNLRKASGSEFLNYAIYRKTEPPFHKESLTIKLMVPKGYELTGEYRCPRKGEFVLNRFDTVRECQAVEVTEDFDICLYPILRKANQ